jgi:hypothetical protein
MAAGPLSGLFLVGSVAETLVGAVLGLRRRAMRSSIPVESVIKDATQAAEVATAVLEFAHGEIELTELLQEVDKILDAVLPPYRHVSEVIENRVMNE